MSTPRIVEVKLAYGCFIGRSLPFPEVQRPVLIYGPNGSGKTTILEGIVRVLFGFNRRQADDREILEQRQPWDGGPATGQVTIRSATGELWVLERTFETGEVEFRRIDPPGETWRGDGNPGADNPQAREYRKRLNALIGFPEREGYEATACLPQGALARTRLGQHLLHLAAGGHGEVEEAKRRIRSRFRALTLRPIVEGERPARARRLLEELDEELETLEEQLAHAERAERKRRPLLEEKEELEEKAAGLRGEVEALEAAREPLLKRRAVEAELSSLEDRVQRLVRARERIDGARRSLTDARRRYREVADPAYPEDFPERLARLEGLWKQREELDGEVSDAAARLRVLRIPGWVTPAIIAGGAVVAGGAVAMIEGWAVAGTVAVLVGGALALVAALRRRDLTRERGRVEEQARRLEGTRTDVEKKIQEVLEGIPDGDTLAPQNAVDRRRRFEDRRKAREVADGTLEELRRAVRHGWEEAKAGIEEPGDGPTGQLDSHEQLAAAADAVENTLREREAEGRNALAQRRLELKGGAAASLVLPDGVGADPDSVSAAIRSRREDLADIQRRIQAVESRLRDEASPVESPVALRDRAREVQERKERVEEEVQAHAAAFRLLQEAYEEFRREDESRLLGRVSERIEALSGGALGPIESEEQGLEAARLHAFGRLVPLATPPLSFGEYHTALFGVRLGATDFLATSGITPPLLVDEPFAHLDEGHAEAVWKLLCAIAEERQVIVSTQDGLLVDHLGIRSDVELARVGVGHREAAEAASGMENTETPTDG